MNSGTLQDRTNRPSGDNTRTGGCRPEHDYARCGFAGDRVWNRALNPRDAEKVLFRLFHTLRNGGRDFLGFAVAHSHHAVTVANDNKRGEAEATTTLDDLRDTIDRNDALEVIRLLLARRPLLAVTAFAASASVGS